MKLIHQSGTEIALPDDLLWVDEFDWSPLAQTAPVYSLAGAMLVQQGIKLAGRPITLKAQPDMAWITRATAETLQQWVAKPGQFTLQFEYTEDKRQFKVIFDNSATAIKAEPAVGFPAHEAEDWFVAELRFLQVA